MASLVWAFTFISGCVVHDSVGIIVYRFIVVCVYLLQNWQPALACNRHEKRCFLLQENTDRLCFAVVCCTIKAISFVSEYHNHPSARHESTHQRISFGNKILHVLRSVKKKRRTAQLFVLF